MTQSERREYLIEYLLKEDRKIFRQKMPSDKEGQENLLHSLMNVRMPKPASCYRECLKLADQHGVTSIAFCCLSTGVFRFPQQEAARIATQTVKKYYEDTDSQMKVIFNVFKDEGLEIYREILD